MTQNKKINIGLIGYGTVGSGVIDYFQNPLNRERLDGYNIEFIGVKDSKTRDNRIGRITQNSMENIVQNPNIDLVVDAISGDDGASLEYVRQAILRGKHVVTCNKPNIASNIRELTQLANNHGVNLEYEASVCGGIPVIKTLKEYFANDNIKKITGIVNGTSNYILTQMHLGRTYDEALREAIDLGYTEKEDHSDVDGSDAASKLAIIASLAFNTHIRPRDIPIREGIRNNINQHDIFYVKDLMSTREKKKHEIKLIASAERKGDSLELRVSPCYIDENHPLYGTNNVLNRICISGEYSGIQTLSGPGAGSLPTGFAVISGIFAIGDKIRRGIVSPVQSFDRSYRCIVDNPVSNGYIKSVSPEDQLNVFGTKATILAEHGISIKEITDCPEFEDENHTAPGMYLIKPASEYQIKAAVRDFTKNKFVIGPVIYVREDKI